MLKKLFYTMTLLACVGCSVNFQYPETVVPSNTSINIFPGYSTIKTTYPQFESYNEEKLSVESIERVNLYDFVRGCNPTYAMKRVGQGFASTDHGYYAGIEDFQVPLENGVYPDRMYERWVAYRFVRDFDVNTMFLLNGLLVATIDVDQNFQLESIGDQETSHIMFFNNYGYVGEISGGEWHANTAGYCTPPPQITWSDKEQVKKIGEFSIQTPIYDYHRSYIFYAGKSFTQEEFPGLEYLVRENGNSWVNVGRIGKYNTYGSFTIQCEESCFLYWVVPGIPDDVLVPTGITIPLNTEILIGTDGFWQRFVYWDEGGFIRAFEFPIED